jgi:hypothetical protein
MRTIADHRSMTLRDLAERRSGGAIVTLLWDPRRDQVMLRYVDVRSGDSFVVDVPNDAALNAFHHPHVYRPAELEAA